MQKQLKLFTALVLALLLNLTVKAQKYTLSGIVLDKNTGETMIGAYVQVSGATSGTSTNNYGWYSISLPRGTISLIYSFIGYTSDTIKISLEKDEQQDIKLNTGFQMLNGVTIQAKRNRITEPNMSSHSMNIQRIKSIPAFLGLPDVVRSLQLLPGIQTTNEGTTNLSIRGGTHDQNLFLLDEAPVYNPDHSLSFFSAFNPDAIKDITVYKGSFPAQYGGRLSSVIDIRMKEGNNQKMSGTANVGLIASGLTLEGPIIKDKCSFIVSGRYSYAGTMANAVHAIINVIPIYPLRNMPGHNKIRFYDLNAKLNYTLNAKNRLYVSAYGGQDRFFFRILSNNSCLDWGNQTFTARWNHIHNSRVFSNHSFIFSNYGYSYLLLDDQRKFEWNSNLKEVDLKSDFDWYINANNHVKFGSQLSVHEFSPGSIEKRDTTSTTRSFTLGKQKVVEAAIYASNEQKIGEKIHLQYGMRYNAFVNIGSRKVYTYDHSLEHVTDTLYYESGEIINLLHGLEPRVTLTYVLGKNNSIKGSYARTKQYVQQISNSAVGLPTDIWLPANNYIVPLSSDQYSLGYFNKSKNDLFESSIELYYRKINHIIDYRDNADLFLNDQIETQILLGTRKAYGVELMIQKEEGRLNGWVSATYSRVMQQIDGINERSWYHASFDKPINLSITTNYEISKRWIAGCTFKIASGGYTTMPKEAFYYNGIPFVQYTSRNGYELPLFHQLDLSIVYKSKKNDFRNWKSEWSFGAYNLYNRKNIFSLFADYDFYNQIKINKLYLYGIVPFVNYSIKF